MRNSDPSDPELLADWHHHRRERAFHALVARYAGLVQATARRSSGDESMAAEISQLTFITLARKAKSLNSCTSLGGWLHRTALMHAKNLIRQKRREARKRQHLAMEPEPSAHPGDAWQEMQPVLDDALAALSDKDREALLLRFYRSLSVREVAANLGIATDAAQKRIDRATDRLRGKLASRGCQAGGSLGGVILAGFAADAQAATLSVSLLSSKAIAAGTVGTSFTSILGTLTIMNVSSLILPALSLAIAGAWLGNQYLSISSLESESAALKEAMLARPSRNGPSLTAAMLISNNRAESSKEPLDWENIDSQMRIGMSELVSQRLVQRIHAMTRDDLVAALDEMAVLDLSQGTRGMLERWIIAPLADQDPEYVLARFVDRIQKSPMTSYLTPAMENWAKTDPAKAGVWLDQQIAAGKFDNNSLDGKSKPRLKFEGKLIQSLLTTDLQAATSRLAALPEDQRGEALACVSVDPTKEEDQLTFAQLVRDQVPKEKQVQALKSQVHRIVEVGGYSKVVEYLDRIQATPTERIACVEQAAVSKSPWNKKITKEHLDTMREWLTAQAPASTENITARELCDASTIGGMEISEATDLAIHYATVSGNDDVLVAFVKTARSMKIQEHVRMLLDKVSEPKRAEILKQLESSR